MLHDETKQSYNIYIFHFLPDKKKCSNLLGRGYFIVFITCQKSESKNNCLNVWKSENNTMANYHSFQKSESLKVWKSENPLYLL